MGFLPASPNLPGAARPSWASSSTPAPLPSDHRQHLPSVPPTMASDLGPWFPASPHQLCSRASSISPGPTSSGELPKTDRTPFLFPRVWWQDFQGWQTLSKDSRIFQTLLWSESSWGFPLRNLLRIPRVSSWAKAALDDAPAASGYAASRSFLGRDFEALVRDFLEIPGT